MRTLLEKYLDCEIGMNVEKPLTIESVFLSAVHETYFSVRREKDLCTYHIPFLNVVKIIENAEGVTVGGFLQHKHTYPVVVKIGHVQTYAPS